MKCFNLYKISIFITTIGNECFMNILIQIFSNGKHDLIDKSFDGCLKNAENGCGIHIFVEIGQRIMIEGYDW